MNDTQKISVLLALVVGLGAGCGKHQEVRGKEERPGGPAVPVKVMEVSQSEQRGVKEVVGSVASRVRAKIEARTPGRIEKLPVRLGELVKEGDILAEIDAREARARVDQAAANLEQAQADLKRFTILFEQQALTRADFDAAQSRFKVAQGALREVESSLSYATVQAPFTGVVVRKLAEVGDLAAPGKPLLELEDPQSFRFIAEVPEALAGAMERGATMAVLLEAGKTELSGKVVEVAPGTDPVSRTLRVELELPGHQGVRSGMFGRLLIPGRGQRALLVPSNAVLTRGQLETVFVAKTNTAQLRLVKTGRRTSTQVEILGGLDPGEQIILQPPASLRDGMKISIE